MKNKRKLYPEEFGQWYNNPNEETQAVLLKRIKPIINKAITSYAGGNQAMKTRAYILANQALRTYDPTKDIKLETYLLSQLQQLNRRSRERAALVHVPENIFYNKQKIYQAESEFFEKHGREPNDDELSDISGMSSKHIKTARSYLDTNNDSGYTNDKGDSMLSKDRSASDIWQDYVHHDLDDTDKKIYEWTTGYQGTQIKSKAEIAKALKISAPAVSYRVSGIVKKLQEEPSNGIE